MKKLMKRTWAVLIVVSLVLALVSCGGGNSPQSLAKQVIANTAEAAKLIEQGVKADDPKFTALLRKSEEVNRKVEALSESDREIFDEEVKKLMRDL